jgi:DNA-binding IclR family transcriptional regulator
MQGWVSWHWFSWSYHETKPSLEEGIMTFLDAFALYPYDVERIAEVTGLAPSEVDRLINDLMERRYQKRVQYSRRPA